MSAFHDNALMGASGSQGYQISRSVRLRSSASAYFNRTFGAPTNQKIGTFSFWVKRGSLGARRTLVSNDTGSVYGYWEFDSSDRLNFGDVFAGNWTSTSVYRDPSAWYHIVIALDSTAAVNSDRIKVYINNRQDITGSATVTQNANWYLLQNASAQIGAFTRISTYFDGYLTEINFIDGQALTPSSFGETDTITGVWKPKKYAGTYGTNGFYLNFSDNSNNTSATIGKDYSGNGNNWTPNNISVTSGVTYDSMLDVPTMWADGGNGRGNYCTWNPLSARTTTLTNGNLAASTTTGMCAGTIAVSSGKWYWECTPTDTTAQQLFGIISASNTAFPTYPGQTSDSYGYYAFNGNKYTGGTATAYGAAYGNNDVIGVALDLDAGTLVFYKNGTSQGTAYSGLSGTFMPAAGDGATNAWVGNFGQRPFAYTPPSGFKALNTQNLPDSTIKKGNQYMDVRTWSGDGATPKAVVTDLGFQPDLIWAKARSNTYDHMLFDSVRGAGSTKDLSSNTTGAEGATGATYGYVSSIDSAGFTVTKGSGATNVLNQSGQTFAAWNWKKGATQGFDIVTFTGTGANQSINHNLGVAPKMMISKRRDAGPSSWVIAFDYAGFTWSSDYFQFDTGAKRTDGANTVWRQAPSSTVFYVGSNFVNTGTYVAYLFSEVDGFSRMGSYQGNGSSDGPFVYCGFRPRWLLVKKTNATSNWSILDTARDDFNVADNPLLPNLSNAESTSTSTSGAIADILSNGFKARGNSGDINDSGATYIFAAFAENPFKFSIAR